jgi:hypothetical protein
MPTRRRLVETDLDGAATLTESRVTSIRKQVMAAQSTMLSLVPKES